MAEPTTGEPEEIPMGIAFGAALVGELGPCPGIGERCPIRPGELHAPEKCRLEDCPRDFGRLLRHARDVSGPGFYEW